MTTARCQNIFKALKGIDKALEGTDTFWRRPWDVNVKIMRKVFTKNIPDIYVNISQR